MLNPEVQSSLARGIEQWLWFLGVDTRHSEDNLLVRHGFLKFKPPGTHGSSRYRLRWRGARVELHSFCVGVYPEEADGFIFTRAHNNCFLYVARRPPCPGNYRDDSLITPETGEELRRFHAAASQFLLWLEEYECWVDRTCGPSYRAACYEAYHLKWLPPASGRDWFQRFRRRPRAVDAVTPVVPDTMLHRSNVALAEAHSVPPPLPVSPSTVVWPLAPATAS